MVKEGMKRVIGSKGGTKKARGNVLGKAKPGL